MYYRTACILPPLSPPGLLYLGRYIDDLIGIWVGPPEAITEIFRPVVDEDIRLTFVIGGKAIEALDLTLSIEPDGSISSKLYKKPMEGTQFVHWASYHTLASKKAIPYSQLIRLKRNCTFYEDFRREAIILLKRFRNRGFPFAVLRAAANKVLRAPRLNLLQKSLPTNNDRMIIVVDFDKNSHRQLKMEINRFYEKLLSSPIIKEREVLYGCPIPTLPPLIAYRAGPSLGSKIGPTYKMEQPVPPS